MSIDYVIQHAAPTLAGIKTGNLFPCTFASTQDMVRDLREILARDKDVLWSFFQPEPKYLGDPIPLDTAD